VTGRVHPSERHSRGGVPVIRLFYDTEFIEDGRTIDLISIGMVAEDGRELYAVSRDAPWGRIRKHDWLMTNVVPHLPHGHGDWRNHMPKSWLIDFDDPAVMDRTAIAEKVRDFIQATPDPQLWADYGAYDHVVLAQLFGRMVDLPAGVPVWTSDLRQEMARLGVTDGDLPANLGRQHNALDDARHVAALWHSLQPGGSA
jgi:hypothetical protein